MGKTSAGASSERAVRYRAELFEIVNRKWDEGMTYNEIATQLGITVAAVRSKIRGRLRNVGR